MSRCVTGRHEAVFCCKQNIALRISENCAEWMITVSNGAVGQGEGLTQKRCVDVLLRHAPEQAPQAPRGSR